MSFSQSKAPKFSLLNFSGVDSFIQEHNCVRELRGVVQQQQIKLADMQMDFSELRMQHNQLKHDLRSVKVPD